MEECVSEVMMLDQQEQYREFICQYPINFPSPLFRPLSLHTTGHPLLQSITFTPNLLSPSPYPTLVST